MKNELSKEAIAHIVERPAQLETMVKMRGKAGKVVWLAETLKIMEKTKAMCYDEAEFARDFSGHKHYGSYLKKRLMDLGVKKPRFLRDAGKVWIWCND